MKYPSPSVLRGVKANKIRKRLLNTMPEIHEYLGNSNMEFIEEAVSRILLMLDKHKYSSKALYIAQEFLIDELLELENALGQFKSEAKRLRKEAAKIALKSKKEFGTVTLDIRESLRNFYQEADDIEYTVEVLRFGR